MPKHTSDIFWHKQIVAKLYWEYILTQTNHSKIIPGVQFGCDFRSETVLGVCFGYEFHRSTTIDTPAYLCVVEYVYLLRWPFLEKKRLLSQDQNYLLTEFNTILF